MPLVRSKHNNIIEWSFVLLLTMPSLNYYINCILEMWFGLASISPIVYVGLAIIGIFSYGTLFELNNTKLNFFIFVLLIGSLIALSSAEIGQAIMGNLMNPLESPLLMLYLYCIPICIMGASIFDWQKVNNILQTICVLIIILFFTSYVVFRMLDFVKIEYMSISYNALLASCVCFGYGIKGEKIVQSLIGLMGFVLIVLIGARGAAVCSVLFIVLYIIRFLFINKTDRRSIYVMTIVAFSLALICFLPRMEDLISTININSRVFSHIEEGAFFTSNGRSELRGIMKEGILDNPFGYGLWGDKVILNKYSQYGANTYSHNIILDFIAYFGIFFGPILFFMLLRKVYKILIPIRVSSLSEMVIVLLPYGFISLLFSGSMSTNFAFFALLGILMRKQTNSADNKWYIYE